VFLRNCGKLIHGITSQKAVLFNGAEIGTLCWCQWLELLVDACTGGGGGGGGGGCGGRGGCSSIMLHSQIQILYILNL
jgi:hypothetical protein